MSKDFRVAELTASQEKRLDQYRDEWIAVGLSTAPADRDEAEKAFRLAYKHSGLAAPKVSWRESPLVAMASLPKKSVLDQLHTNMISSARKAVEREVAPEVIRLVETRVRDVVGARMEVAAIVGCEAVNRVTNERREKAPKALETKLDSDVESLLGPMASGISPRPLIEKAVEDEFMGACLNSFEAGYFGFYDYMYRVLGVRECRKIEGLLRAARSCGMFWPFAGRVIAVERPSKIAFDDQGRVHSAIGYAVEYPGGFGAYAWHGVRVPADAILQSDTIAWPVVESFQDQEVREALAEAKAWAWSGGEADKYDAALAAKRLGGVLSMKDLIEGGE